MNLAWVAGNDKQTMEYVCTSAMKIAKSHEKKCQNYFPMTVIIKM